MKKFHFKHSLKNIPLGNRKQYHSIMISKVESLIQRMRWKLIAVKSEKVNQENHYGFKTTNNAPQIDELKPFEDDVYKLITSIEFKKVNNDFQTSLQNTIKSIKDSKDIIIESDKTKNLYSIPPNEYQTILKDNITSVYKKSDETNVINVNKEAAELTSKLNIADRVDEYITAEAFLTVKDHKANFPDRKEYRLLNPAKSNLGRVSKIILDEAIKNVKTGTNLNLWKNSSQVIEWFKNLQNKENLTFFKFDVVSFYPSISKTLFNQTIDWAKQYHTFSEVDIEIIQNTRKSFLYLNQNPWIKQEQSDFDITMGSFDGAECCELVGLFILSKLIDILHQSNVGLYRDDGLAAVSGSGPQIERMRKQVFSLFKDIKLKVTIECNITSTEFLDAYFDLKNNTFKPFTKPNTDILYINTKSNHPINIKKEIPKMVCDRICKLSSSKEIFDNEKIPFKEALKSAGHNTDFQYSEHQTNQRVPKCRRKKVIWFNPPFCQTVKTNLARKFLQLVDKHFKNTPLHKYFNRSTVKVSYCCMPNIKAIIAGHNKHILRNTAADANPTRLCNCRGGQSACPVDGYCLKESLIYKAEVINTTKPATYIGNTSNTFKTRLTGHKQSFNHAKYQHRTSLSSYLWNLKKDKIDFDLKWSILSQAPAYTPISGSCKLCNLEKVNIIYSKDNNLLNKRSEINCKCRHREKFLLVNHLEEDGT